MLLVVADVEGKGVASALVMANLQATLRALVVHVHALEALVESINKMIVTDTRAQKYLSMFVATLDQPRRMLHYINCGHVPPAVVRASGESVFLEEGGMVVGLFPNVKYRCGSVQLERGDIVVVCTDGITEAMDMRDTEYSRERLVEAVRGRRKSTAQEIVQSLFEEVDQYSRGGSFDDDRVLLALKVL